MEHNPLNIDVGDRICTNPAFKKKFGYSLIGTVTEVVPLQRETLVVFANEHSNKLKNTLSTEWVIHFRGSPMTKEEITEMKKIIVKKTVSRKKTTVAKKKGKDEGTEIMRKIIKSHEPEKVTTKKKILLPIEERKRKLNFAARVKYNCYMDASGICFEWQVCYNKSVAVWSNPKLKKPYALGLDSDIRHFETSDDLVTALSMALFNRPNILNKKSKKKKS